MEPRLINAFADVNLDDGLKVAIARDLKHLWSELLREPLPTELRRLIDRLEQATRGQSLGPLEPRSDTLWRGGLDAPPSTDKTKFSANPRWAVAVPWKLLAPDIVHCRRVIGFLF